MTQNLHPRTRCGALSRTLGTALAALLIAAPVTLPAQQQRAATETEDEIIHGIADEPGQTLQELRASASPAGEYSHTDKNKVFFLYNVRTGKFLNMGGYWGVHASLQEYPLALWTDVVKNTREDVINFRQNLLAQQGTYLMWANRAANFTEDDGVFADRGNNDRDGYYGWFMEPLNDAKNTYRLYTYKRKTDAPYDIPAGAEKMYLSAIGTEADVDKNCGARTQTELEASGDWAEGSLWRVISLEQVYKMEDLSTKDFDHPLDMTWKLECGGFSRLLSDLKYWKGFASAVNDKAGRVRFGLEKLHDAYKTNADGKNESFERHASETYKDVDGSTMNFQGPYTFPEGEPGELTFNDRNSYLRHVAKYFCADVRAVHGVFFQDQTITHNGTFIVQCKGYSTTPEAKIFAGVVNPDNPDVLLDGTMHTMVLNQVGEMPAAEQARLHTAEMNMDYAGKEFYGSRQYINTVVVHVTGASEDHPAKLRFGIMVGDLRTKSVPGPEEWTVFDEFRLLYASDESAQDLVLDELRGDVDYLHEATTYQNRTLHLQKTLARNRWNSLVLPVNLTARHVTTTFGANTRLAKLARIEGTEIQFETVNLIARADWALEAYVPYIIFPTAAELPDDATPAYTATVTRKTEGGQEAGTYEVCVQKNHFDIPFVTLATNADNENDLTNMHNHGVSKLTVPTTDGSLTAYGTFVRTFDPGATQKTENKNAENHGTWEISDRKAEIRTYTDADGNEQPYDDLRGSYFFDKGDMYYSDKRPRGLRGFSCWFKPATTAPQQAQPTVYIDGIRQEGMLTAVGELLIGPDAAAASARPRGVYNLQGQRMGDTTDGLPAGLYIVDGVKRVVK